MILSVDYVAMNPYRFLLALVVGCCVLSIKPLTAQMPVSPFAAHQQFSAEQTTTTKEGVTATSKIYMDNGKVRSEITTHGMQVISIIRPDLKKMYTVMPVQKMAMEMPYDPAKIKQRMPASEADGKVEVVGPDVVDGVACTKSKITSKEGKIFFYWVNASTLVPVKMAAEDGAFTMIWKNYQAGPQDASLFEAPSDYRLMTMPSGMHGIPGAGQ